MNPKLIFSALGAALVPAIAVPTSISLTSDSQEGLVENREEKPTQPTQPTPKTIKLLNHKPVRGFRQKPATTSEGYYISRYQDYFLASDQNQDLWEQKFNNQTTPSFRKIEILGDDDDEEEYGKSVVATITSPWDPKNNFDHYESDLNFPLNVFCGEWYKSEGWESTNEWTFRPPSSSVLSDIELSYFWKLCSAFNKKPETISEDQSQLKNLNSNSKFIGNTLKTSLVSINNNDTFWQLRQEEWKKLQTNNSTYFAYQEGKLIKDLCEVAYNKEPSSTKDSIEAPTLDNAKKYCSLEWDFQTR